ncbi:MAG: metal ABC transporter permease [Victivallales bacterium]|jgi:zinc transport system permease protein|nr:metal ABC transporter permease [Victivallales bacterium]
MSFLHDLMRPEMAFLRYALLVGALSSVALGIVGTMVVTRRISSLAGATSHAALGGIGAALFLQQIALPWCSPMVGAIVGAISAALVVGAVNLYAREREDTIINVVWALWMSIGLLFLNWTHGYVDWQGYLFGNILLLTQTEVYLTIGLDLLILVPMLLFYNSILTMSFDWTFAELRGVRVKVIYFSLLILTALAIVLLINVVGIILVIALLTLPAATAGSFTRHLWSMMLLSTILSGLFVVVGLIASYQFNLPSGPAIVVLASAVYLAGLGFNAWRKRC